MELQGSALGSAYSLEVDGNKLATKVNLSRRGGLVVSSLCSFCGKEEETCRHLFFDCSFAWQVWCKCFRWLGVLVVSHIEPKNNFDQFRMSLASEKVNSVWNMVWVGVLWLVRYGTTGITLFSREGWRMRLKFFLWCK